MIRFGCPNCKAVLTAPDNKVGKKSKCPQCFQPIRVPPPPKNRTVLGDTLLPTPQPSPQVPVMECPACRQPLSIGPEFMGRWIKCPKCGTGFTAKTAEESLVPVYLSSSGTLPGTSSPSGGPTTTQSTAWGPQVGSHGNPNPLPNNSAQPTPIVLQVGPVNVPGSPLAYPGTSPVPQSQDRPPSREPRSGQITIGNQTRNRWGPFILLEGEEVVYSTGLHVVVFFRQSFPVFPHR
jgi:hypothetical protein